MRKKGILCIFLAMVLMFGGCKLTDALLSKKEPVENVNEDGAPIIGTNDSEYEGYEHLEAIELAKNTRNDTQNGNQLMHYVMYYPKSDNYNTGTYYCDSMGKHIRFNLELTYYGYNQTGENVEEDYLYAKMERSILENEWYNPEQTEVIKQGEGYCCSVTYVEKDYDGEVEPKMSLYYISELDGGVIADIQITISDGIIDYDLAETIQELETFYQIDIPWDEELMDRIVSNYENSDAVNECLVKLYSTDCNVNLLPDWEVVEDEFIDDSFAILAPKGNPQEAGEYIKISHKSDFSEAAPTMNSRENAEKYMKDVYGDEATIQSHEIYYESDGIKAIKMKLTMSDGSKAQVYVVSGKYYAYIVLAESRNGDTSECFSMAADIVDDKLIPRLKVKNME